MLLGQPTVQDVRELIAAKDYTIAQMSTAHSKVRDQWEKANKDEHAEWWRDWLSFNERYAMARRVALASVNTMTSAAVPDSMNPSPVSYALVLKTLTRDPDKGVQKGDLQDLFDRLAKKTKVDLSNTPQPKSDVDLEIYRKTEFAKGSNYLLPAAMLGGGMLVGGLLAWKIAR